MDTKQDATIVKAVGKTMLIFEALARTDHVGVTEIATHTGMSKATAFRFLTTLETLGYVRQDGKNAQYSLTLKLFEVGSLVRARRTKLDDIKPMLSQLAADTRETVHLATIESGHLVYLDKIESTHTLKVSMISEIGYTAPLYCTGVGKVLLAFTPDQDTGRLIGAMELRRYTPNTITDPDQLRNELQRIQDAGYAVDNEEHELGVRCIAAPIRNGEGTVVAALSVSVPSVRLTNENFEQYRSRVLETARAVSEIAGSSDWKT